MFHDVLFSTRDRVMIHGSYYQLPTPKATVLCLHMMPADRTSWRQFQERLGEVLISSLAIDLRGHGESTQADGKVLDYRTFSDEDHLLTELDVEAAIEWLIHRDVDQPHLGIIGASIGANLGLRSAVRFHLPSLVLLSPGENYHGVRTYEAAKELESVQHLLAIASDPDDAESYRASQEIVALASCKDKQLKTLTAAGHGTHLFVSKPNIMDECVAWFARTLHSV